MTKSLSSSLKAAVTDELVSLLTPERADICHRDLGREMWQFLVCSRPVNIPFQVYKSLVEMKVLKISDEELYFDAPISMKGLSKLRSDVPMLLTWTFSYLLLQPKERHFSQYLEGPHSPVACLSSQLPNQQMAVGSVACFQEVHGRLCYKDVLGHLEPPVVQSLLLISWFFMLLKVIRLTQILMF